MYELSKDYKALYKLIRECDKVVAFVDYKSLSGAHTGRDVCLVERKGAWQISITVRWLIYGEMSDLDDGTGMSEGEVFCKLCESLNLAFIPIVQ